MPIKLIVGLRNPGSKYTKTRHNVGEWMLRAISSAGWLTKKDFFGDVAELQISGQKVWGLLPNTYMNLSGQAVAAMSRFYRLFPQEILVIHDDLDLPVGVVRLKQGGGHGGHNGLQDIIRHLGADFRWPIMFYMSQVLLKRKTWILQLSVRFPMLQILLLGT